jgi:hypothetical protein
MNDKPPYVVGEWDGVDCQWYDVTDPVSKAAADEI